MTKNIRELADRFYEIVNGGEGDFSEIFSSDFVFGIMPGFPYGGNYNGLDETNAFSINSAIISTIGKCIQSASSQWTMRTLW